MVVMIGRSVTCARCFPLWASLHDRTSNAPAYRSRRGACGRPRRLGRPPPKPDPRGPRRAGGRAESVPHDVPGFVIADPPYDQMVILNDGKICGDDKLDNDPDLTSDKSARLRRSEALHSFHRVLFPQPGAQSTEGHVLHRPCGGGATQVSLHLEIIEPSSSNDLYAGGGGGLDDRSARRSAARDGRNLGDGGRPVLGHQERQAPSSANGSRCSAANLAVRPV